jgi:hypothetical protein
MTRSASAVFVAASVLAAACASSSGPAGYPVDGAVDMHCSGPDGGDGGITIVMQSACSPPDGGTMTSTVCPWGDTNSNTRANDDDCKYQVSFRSSPIYENQDVSFTVSATHLSDGSPVTGAQTQTEIFLGSPNPTEACPIMTRPAPNPPAPERTRTVESPPGTYMIGPLRFDAPGDWTVRFHFYETCFDAPESPHGHAAFLIHVP